MSQSPTKAIRNIRTHLIMSVGTAGADIQFNLTRSQHEALRLDFMIAAEGRSKFKSSPAADDGDACFVYGCPVAVLAYENYQVTCDGKPWLFTVDEDGEIIIASDQKALTVEDMRLAIRHNTPN